MMNKLGLETAKISEAKKLASGIVDTVQEYILGHTTVTVERATLRLMGVDGADRDGVPVANLIVDRLGDKLEYGASRYFVNALIRENCSVPQLCERIAGGFDITSLALAETGKLQSKAKELVDASFARIKANVAHRSSMLTQYPPKDPLLYVIVATGNIYEDVKQAQAAALQGADVIAVIRTTAQSLLDYVPFGATTEGFGGTYATQENFRIMREAIDAVVPQTERYVRIVNYCSGLCMPEIAAMGALERLDMMLNDSMYGILFRDINMYRTFVDQRFSRMINAYADIIINTGEDNYLTTSDAVEKAYTVLASQMINEQFGYRAGLPARLLGLGHAFEIDPSLKGGFLYELSQAQMAREIFPDCPLKYMPPTKFMMGDIFKGYAMNTMFNFVSKLTGQSIHLLGMLTEAIHTPFVADRDLAINNAKYVMNSIEGLADEICFKKDGVIVKRAHEVVDETLAFLREVAETGLFNAIEQGKFADVKRPRHGGKGLEGVKAKAQDYWNPVEERLTAELKVR
jgi:beta-lysine 5,6-aminomutase alpha subunit